MDGNIGEVRMFAGNFAPRNWARCEGQLLAIADHNALFSILGTSYGGDGRTTFGLPDLRGRAPVGVGRGPGLTNIGLGERLGVDEVTLTSAQLPKHNHATETVIKASSNPGTLNDPAGGYWSDPSNNVRVYTDSHDSTMAADAVTVTVADAGLNAAHENHQPSVGINFIICLEGIYPSRS